MSKDKILDIAKKIAKDNNPMVFYIIKILFSDQFFSIYCLIYTYFRWLDDQIDSSFISKNNNLLLLNRQKENFINLYTDSSYDKVIVQNIYERMLIKVIAYDILNNCKLKKYIKQLLDALEFDVNRRYKLCSQIDLSVTFLRVHF